MNANQARNEYKFLLRSGIMESFCQELAEHLPSDQGAENGYQIESEYFDDERRSKYWEKKLGAPSRRRVRTRAYGDESGERQPTVFIEVKHKVDGDSVKRRVLLDQDELGEIVERQLPVREGAADQKVLNEIRNLIAEPSCRPVVRIRYHRYAFDEGPESLFRVTLDRDLTCRYPTPDGYGEPVQLLEPNQGILEVKSIGPVPYWFRLLIAKYHLIPQSFSKFMIALDHKYEKSTLVVS
ncbi:polyphosphate polymerase domain-containing protein [Roseibacillus persicicus]|uniref:polyphosphate polymerase domain-containing protein n=1 Tax=Roseibacillus persicicus TaxID=454148 RepID=UPI0028109C49|nr:polyphosphate polymerase domain-containing protein [Roseibacillus persicicus]MDQ8192319.1 polyphosphate polymerase domain-containing protein [Roseibacillus persicicus]